MTESPPQTEPTEFPTVPKPPARQPGDGNRRDRWGNKIRSRAKPVPAPPHKRGHEVKPRYTERVGMRGVQAVCKCGWEGIWYEIAAYASIEQAAANGDLHCRGLR